MYLYEKAIIEDINNLFKNGKVKAVIADSLDEALRRTAAENQDKITLPFIVLSGGDWTLNDTAFYNIMHGAEIYRKDNTSKNESEEPNIPLIYSASGSEVSGPLATTVISSFGISQTSSS